MRVHLATVNVAQCAICGGVLVAAGDDWRHLEQGSCTELGRPEICWRSDCGMPAAVGCEACAQHAGALSSAEGIRLRSSSATV